MADLVDVNANSEFFYSNVKSVTTDFNVSPYYDDFDGQNNYYKILFKPGYAVQARELTQIQSILQEQINRFGQHIFKEGSMVLGGKFTLDTRVNYVKVNDFDLSDNAVNIQDFKDQIVTGQTTGIQAYVNLVLDGAQGTDKPKTLYVSYLSGNPDTGEVVFAPNEPLVSNVGTLVVGNTVPVGYGSVFTINEGIRFAKEHFIYHSKQAVVVDRYDIFPTCKVGFTLEESIVNSSQDSTLLDPALESSNYSAPGGDRFKITPVLTRLDIDETAGFPDYVNLFIVDKGKVTEINERPIYNVIRDEIAKRTMDESGDYYVRGFNTVIEEHLDLNNNGGYLSSARGGDSQLLSIQVEPGTAYVKGYEVNKLVTQFLTTPKSTSFSNVTGQILQTRLGSSILINEIMGVIDVNSGQQIDLYDTAQTRVSSAKLVSAAQIGNKIGTARIKSVSKYVDANLGTANGTLDLHIFDVNMIGSNSFSNVKSVFCNYNSSKANLSGDVVLTANTAKIQDVYASLLYYAGSDYTKTIRSPDGTISTAFFFKKTSDVSISPSGTFSLTSTIDTEEFPYGTATLSSTEADNIFLTLNESFNIAIPGTALSGGGTTTLNGSSTFFSRLNVGDKIEITGNSKSYVVSSIANNTTLTVTENLPATLSGNSFYKAYKAGDMIDLTGVGSDAGATRTVQATTSALTFDLKETFGGSKLASVTYSMARKNAREMRKVLRRNRYVLIDCSSNAGANTGPYNLGFSDVYRVNSIRKLVGGSFSTVTDGTDVTTDFIVDNGQRDSFYGNANIIPNTILSSSTKLLVCLDYFQPDYTLGVGYFSVDSYPVNDINPTADQISTSQIPTFISRDTGIGYDLRNYLDFRPVFTNTAADATSLTGISTNPSVSTALQYEFNGLRIPADAGPVIYNYSYYLARRDVVCLNKSGQFMIIQGVPSPSPVTPACPQYLMSIAKLYIPPYPSLSPTYAKILGRSDQSCKSSKTAQIRFTMKDIGVLKQRVDNLENYVSLSLLEKSALDLKILDENGLDRFKNGIFVDSFTSFLSSDTSNPDHHICYDPKEGSIRPLFETQAVGYDLVSNTNIVINSNMLMLPYTEVVAVRQPFATTTRNVETTVYRFVGKMYLDPDSDYWVNTKRLASQTFNFGATDADVTPYSVVYGSWQTTVTGITTTDPTLISTSVSGSTSGTGGTVTSSKSFNIIPQSQYDYYSQIANTGNVSIGGGYSYPLGSTVQQAIGSLIKSVTTVENLVSIYGASTPIRITGTSAGGSQALLAGSPLNFLDQYKTLGDVANNSAAITSQINGYGITIIETTSVGTKSITNTYSTITTTGSQASRDFTETFQSLQTESQSLGDKVVTVAPIADIRPQTIAFEARGVKASTRHYVYFDGELMSAYVTPGLMSNVTSQFANTNAALITASGSEGGSLYSNENGIVCGFLRIPSDSVRSFRTGTKEVIVTDSPTNEPDATSFAKAHFAAQGINQTVQETIISTSTVVTETKSGVEKQPIVYSNTTNTYTVTSTVGANVSTYSGVLYDLMSCMAYSFKLNTPNGEEGTFLSSVDVFFSGKDPNLGVWFEIRAMDNAGNITKVQVPDSEVWLTSNQVNTSDDGSVATNVKFKVPIFLQNNQEYAFVIHTVGINPNYYMYVSVLGEVDILTKKVVNDRPLTGTLFTTNNNTDWDIVPRVDLKCTFNRAKFQTGVLGEAIIGNQHREYIQLPLSTRTGANTSWFGDRILGNDRLSLSSPTGIIVTDYLVGANSGANGQITSIDGSTYRVDTTGFIVNESVSVIRANGYNSSITTTVVSKNTAEGQIYSVVAKNDRQQFNGNTALLVVSGSNGLFEANDTLHMELSGNTVSTVKVSKQIYSEIQFEPSYLDFIPTTCDFSMLTVSNTGSVGQYNPIVLSVPVYYNSEMALYSRSEELSLLSGDRSNRVKVTMSSVSDYMTPVVNLNRTYTVYIHNLINSNTSNELLSSGGALKNKYISQVITLADGQDAEDLRIILSAYRPPSSNSDIKVYVRVAAGEDFESIYSKTWIPMESFNDQAYSSLSDRKNWREFQYKFPDSVLTGRNDQELPIIEYTNSANSTFQGFKQYQIKIGLQSDSSAIYPRVADLRAIALQR